LTKTPLPLAGGAGEGSVPSRQSPSSDPSRKREGEIADNTVTLAAVSGAHGVTGEVRLKLFAESIDSLKHYKSFNDGALTVKSLRPTKDGAIARFAEINDRNAAEKLRSTVLTVPREALPELGEGEYYYSDLLGLPCVSTDGTELGKCIAVENFGASDVLEIQKPDGKKFMVPMTLEAVPEWGEQIVIEASFVI
jgi:16S rRNA processing protein RimM